jgi:hypothetical protein
MKSELVASFKDRQGYYDDKPKTKGDQFLAVQVRYEATGDGATYNACDWSLYVDDEKVQAPAFVIHGPRPALIFGELPSGKKASGLLVWEVPKTGRVVLSYEPVLVGALFEVVLRTS